MPEITREEAKRHLRAEAEAWERRAEWLADRAAHGDISAAKMHDHAQHSAGIYRLALAALEDAARYEQAIRWALGEDGEFAMWPGYGEGRRPADGLSPRVGYFWWRTELRQRAAIDRALAAQEGA